MTPFTLLLLISCYINYTFSDCVLDHRSLENTWAYKLREDIFCNYDPNYAPVNNKTDNVKVRVTFIMKYFGFTDGEDIIKINSWVILRWYDQRLKWDPKKYDGVKSTTAMSIYIWTPELKLFNTNDLDEYHFIYTQCQIKYTGFVICIPRITHKVVCSTHLKNWPYDSKICSLHFGSYRKTYPRVHFTFADKRGISALGADYGSGWVLYGLKKMENSSADEQLSLTFQLDRQAEDLVALFIVPSILISILTLMCLFIHVSDRKRLALLCFSLFIHYYMLQEFSLHMPKQSNDVPVILLYARGSIIMTILALLLTVLLKFLRKRKISAPLPIVSVNDFVSQYNLKPVVAWVSTEPFAKNDEDIRKDWDVFADIANCFCILVFVVVYVSFQIAFIPQSTPNITIDLSL